MRNGQALITADVWTQRKQSWLDLGPQTKRLLRKRVARGAALVAQADPLWFIHIDINTLALSDGCNCVLGQLACDLVPRRQVRAWRLGRRSRPYYSDALSALNLTDRQAITHGFVDGPGYGYGALAWAWKMRIQQEAS